MVQNQIPNLPTSKPELDVYIGKLLNNRYLIRDLIGKGGMGRVYLAEDVAKGGMPVAVKILLLSLGSQQMSQRFAREIFIGAQLGRKSKNIVRVFSYGVTDDSTPFYVMEYLQGKNLKRILKSEHLAISKFLDICQQICLGLQCAHQGITFKGEIYPIVHRDIKPENIFITEDNQGKDVVKILDFGIAKFLTERSGMTLTDSFIGSLPYCSPEHMEGRKLLDVRSDIYSLGVLMFEMLTGKHPFAATSNSFGSWYQAHRFQNPPAFAEVNPQAVIPPELELLVARCLAKEVGDRPQNIPEILDNLEDVKWQIEHPVATSHESSKSQLPLQLIPATSLSEKECLQKTWPKSKPIAPIGFPHLLHTLQGTVPTVWAMLPKEEISQLLDKTYGTELIAKINVYPMLLWVTVLHNSQTSLTRWLSYFLDMKDIKWQRLLRVLAETGYYHLLFFPLEEPHTCCQVITLRLTASQRQQILDWLALNPEVNEFISPKQAKMLLKAEYETKKARILKSLVVEPQKEKVGFKNYIYKFFYYFLHFFKHESQL